MLILFKIPQKRIFITTECTCLKKNIVKFEYIFKLINQVPNQKYYFNPWHRLYARAQTL